MYRGLDDFMSSDMYDNHLSSLHTLSLTAGKNYYSSHVPSNNNGHAFSVSRARGSTSAKPIPLNRIEVEVHTTQNSVTSQAIWHNLNNNTDEELHDKPHELV